MNVSAANEAEAKVLAAARSGARCFLQNEGAAAPNVKSAGTEVRAEFIGALLLGRLVETVSVGGETREEAVRITAKGLQVDGAFVSGRLDLSDFSADGVGALPPLALVGCRFEQPIILRSASFARLSFSNSRFVAIEAQGVRVEGEVDLEGVASAEGVQNATGALVEGQSAPRCSVNLMGAQIGGTLRLMNSTFGAEVMSDVEQQDRYLPKRYAVDLTAARIVGDVIAQPGLQAQGGVKMRNAQLDGEVWINGAKLWAANGGVALDARGVHVRGYMVASKMEAHAMVKETGSICVDMSEATFHGTVNLNQCVLMAKPHDKNLSWALIALNAEFMHDAHFHAVRGVGRVKIAGSKVHGSLTFDPKALPDVADSGFDLNADDIEAFGPVFISGEIIDTLSLLRSRFHSELSLGGRPRDDGLTFPKLAVVRRTPAAKGVAAGNIEVAGNLEFSGVVAGGVNLERAVVGGTLVLGTDVKEEWALVLEADAALKTPVLSLQDATVKGAVEVCAVRLQGEGEHEVDLSGFTCASFDDGDGKNWDSRLRFALEGMSLSRFPRKQTPAGADGQPARATTAAARVSWLKREAVWSPQPWAAFAQAYRRHGHVEDSNIILVHKSEREFERSVSRWGHLLGLRWLYRWLIRVFWGFGFRWGLSPWRALGVCFSLLIVGWIGVEIANNGRVFGISFDDGGERSALVLSSTLVANAYREASSVAVGTMAASAPPVSGIACGASIDAPTYAVDVFIPLLDLREEGGCVVRSDTWATGWRFAKALYAALGWLTISLTVFTLSGPMRRQTDAS